MPMFSNYDLWKLATPPEYEGEEPEEQDEEPRDYAYEAWARGRSDRFKGVAYTNPPRGFDPIEWQNGWLDEDKEITSEPKF